MSEFSELCNGRLAASSAFEVRTAARVDGSTRTLASVFAEGGPSEGLAARQAQFLASAHIAFWEKAETLPATFRDDRMTTGLFPNADDMVSLPTISSDPDRLARLLNELRDNQNVVVALQMLRAASKSKETMLHADLRSDSTFVEHEKLIVVASPYSCCGPRAVDVAAMVVNYLLYYFVHIRCEQDNDSHRQYAYKLTELCQTAVDEYLLRTADLPSNSSGLDFISQVAGYAGCLLGARATGGEELILKADLAAEVLEAGIRLLNACTRIQSIGKLIFIALMLC